MPKAPEPSSTCQKNTKSLPRISPKSYCYNAVPNRFLAHFSTSRTNGPRLLSRAKAGTHSPLLKGSHTTARTPKQGPSGRGHYHYPRRALRAAETPDGRLSKRLTCRFLRSGEQRSLRSAYFFRIYRIFCRQFQLQTLLRYGIIIFPATCTCNLRFILKGRLLRNVSVIFCRVMI